MKLQTKNSVPRALALLALITVSALLGGCLPVHRFSVEPIGGTTGGPATNPPPAFNGLQAELSDAATNHHTLRLLVLHGMGVSRPGYSTNLVDRIMAELNLKLIAATNAAAAPASDHSVLTTRTFGNGASNVCVYELTWSPITTPIKAREFAEDFEKEQLAARAYYNNQLKTNLVDYCLSDVVLYLGKFRPVLQQPITNTIYMMEADARAHDDPIAIITHSLGSYMVLDSLKMMETNSGEASDVAESYAGRVKQVFMMANQLPILELGERTQTGDEPPGLLAGFYKMHKKGRAKRTAKPDPGLQIVALSDPNDLLSFKLRQRDVAAAVGTEVAVNGFNVTYTVEPWAIAGVFSSPINAHADWWTYSGVPRLLAFGHAATKPAAGKPPGAASPPPRTY